MHKHHFNFILRVVKKSFIFHKIIYLFIPSELLSFRLEGPETCEGSEVHAQLSDEIEVVMNCVPGKQIFRVKW